MLEATTAHLGSNVKAIREQRGLTQGQLSKLCGVPRSTVANLETGGSNPTLGVLLALASGLQTSLEELISAPRGTARVFRSGSLPVLKRGRSGGATVHKLLPHPIPGMVIDRLVLEAGEHLRGTPHRPGTHEYLYCEAGTLALWVSGEQLDLCTGDVASFPGDQRHAYENRGKRPFVGFSVVTLAPVGD